MLFRQNGQFSTGSAILRGSALEPRRNLQLRHDSPTITGWPMVERGKTGYGAGLLSLEHFNLNSGVICAGNGLDSIENGD